MPPSGRSSTESLLERRASGCVAGRAPLRGGRIDRAVERAHPPAVVGLVADARARPAGRGRESPPRTRRARPRRVARLLDRPAVEQSPAATSRRSAARTGRAPRRSMRLASSGASLAVMSARMTTGNSSPLALCTVIRRTPSLPSSTIGASAASPRSAASRSASTKPRNDSPPLQLVLARELRDVQHVGQHLLAAAPQREADVGARLVEQPSRWFRRPARRLRRAVQPRQQRAARRRSARGARAASAGTRNG